MDTADNLIRSIENLRSELHTLAEILGLAAPMVLAKSIELDNLLNQYQKAKSNNPLFVESIQASIQSTIEKEELETIQ